MGIELRRVTTSADCEAIYRFRYSVYVEEMNRPQRYANHEYKRISDPLDDQFARLYGAWNEEGDVVLPL